MTLMITIFLKGLELASSQPHFWSKMISCLEPFNFTARLVLSM